MQEQGITKGDLLQRLAGISFIVGAIVVLVFNALYPRLEDPQSGTEAVQVLADTRGGFMQAVNLFMAVGLWLLMIGFTGVCRAISTGGGAVWARLGYYGVVIGTALWTVGFGLAGFGLPPMAQQWVDASGPAKDMWGVVVASQVNMVDGLVSMTTIFYWLAVVLIGIGMVSSKVFPKWAGWLSIVLGAATAATGVPQGFAGTSQTFTNILFPIFAVLFTVYVLILGVWLLRKAW